MIRITVFRTLNHRYVLRRSRNGRLHIRKEFTLRGLRKFLDSQSR